MSMELWNESWGEVMKESSGVVPMPTRPSLDDMLDEWGPMPHEALVFGSASDGLPVLLNLHDPLPGPMLVIGDPGTGKTEFLMSVARGIEMMHPAEKVQFGALTSHPDEWSGFENIPNNVGIFSIHHKSSEDFILSLASWAHGNKTSQQSVLLLLDDLEAITYMDLDAVQNLRWLLLRGPARRVWPIITLSTKNIDRVQSWMEAFHTRFLGNIQDKSVVKALDAEKADLGSLKSGEFTLREGDGWTRFWVPS